MPDPVVRLPPTITLTLAEAGDVLAALDAVLEHMPPESPERRTVKRANLVVVAKLWPELGALLEDDDG